MLPSAAATHTGRHVIVNAMKTLLIAVSICGLLLTVVPAMLVASGILQWRDHALLMLIGTALWFASAPFWMQRRSQEPDLEGGLESPQ